jgi:hypothetical protein
MAWEWVAPTATGAVGVTGILTTYFAGGRQQRTTVMLAREERRQRRGETAYLDLLALMSKMVAWAETVFPMSGKYEMPDFNVPDDVHDSQALSAYWSDEIVDLVKVWNAALLALRNAGYQLSFYIERGESGDHSGHGQRLELVGNMPRLKADLNAAEEQVRQRVRVELAAVMAVGRRSSKRKQRTAPPPG